MLPTISTAHVDRHSSLTKAVIEAVAGCRAELDD